MGTDLRGTTLVATQLRSITESLLTPPLNRHFAAWIALGVVAWIAFVAINDASTSAQMRHAYWFAAVALFATAGLCASRLLATKHSLDDLQLRLLVLAIGWGVAAAAGWYLHVLVGGPFSGFVVVAALLASQRPDGLRLIMVGLGVLFAGRAVMNVSGNLLVGALITVLTVATTTAITSRLWLARDSALRVFSLVAWWGAAWVFAFWLPKAIGFPEWGGYGRNLLELVVAFGLGGASIARQLSSSWLRAAVSWMMGGAVASIVGVVIDLVLRFGAAVSVGDPFGSQQRFLDVGHCIGMPVGALFALALAQRHAR